MKFARMGRNLLMKGYELCYQTRYIKRALCMLSTCNVLCKSSSRDQGRSLESTCKIVQLSPMTCTLGMERLVLIR